MHRGRDHGVAENGAFYWRCNASRVSGVLHEQIRARRAAIAAEIERGKEDGELTPDGLGAGIQRVARQDCR